MRPPSLPAPKLLSTAFGGLYAVAYSVGGQSLVSRVARRYGPVVALPVLGYGRVVAVADPTLAKQVFTAKPDILLGGEGVGPAAAIYGRRSMFVLEEPEHLRRRKLLTPPLHGDVLRSYIPVIEEATRVAMATWPADSPIRMLDAARELTLEVIVKVIFGAHQPAEVARLGKPFAELLDLALSMETPIRYAARRLGALRTWGALADVNGKIDELILPLIADRRAGTRQRDTTDILSMLVAARTEEGDGLSDKEIRDDVITLMLAGHETTATTLAWLVDLLGHHRRVQQRVRSEVGTGSAVYTEAVINETLRLHPPAPITGRMTAAQYQLGDYTLEPGTRIVLLLDVINRDPATYAEPNEFRPERFLDSRPTPYGWVPFGGGLKRCIGASFSMCELTTMLHTMLQDNELRPYSRRRESPSARGAPVVVPANGARVYVAPLSPCEKVTA
ncbi:Putative cytochrome P450 137 [Mycolicibacterium vanbaalenii]|uniref:Cytochrome P450 137 n=1 Tax=Mycolicibacterium vanbaalenii TaxID=110539 RepID=A0A5S9R8I4_MYCVN|nr:cytochrome P450 [Mycolicibacterium vanbaalenii]CAA0132166.1 Putative cytochrome P450 137 [Mycolicibacterium vanbaalenii]